VRYEFRCHEHGSYIITAPIQTGPQQSQCPTCGDEGVRVYEPVVDVWHTDGAHKTDYNKHGDKLEKLNRDWSRATGEKPPPPAPDIKRNASDLQ
jgi:hypothetical protein